jgi:TrmH family RNA methyltransferase
MNVITSTANPLIKRLRRLEQKKYRQAEQAFLVEGIQPVWAAVETHAGIEVLIVAPELLKSESAQKLVDAQRSAGTRVVQVTRTVFESFAEREHPSGLAAIVRLAPRTLDDLRVTPQALFVALFAVGNPGNLGTIIRTMDAVAGSGVILIGDATDAYHPTAVKASRGTLFSVLVAQVENVDAVLVWAKARGVSVVTTCDHAPRDFWSVVYPRPALILFGSEGEGLPDQVLARGDLSVRIPMAGRADSLNLAVAVGVLLYEVERQRNPLPHPLPLS